MASHSVSINDGANHLHGGVRGWDQALWEPVLAESSIDRWTLKVGRRERPPLRTARHRTTAPHRTTHAARCASPRCSSCPRTATKGIPAK
jgi:hypothetical protein